MTVVSMTTPATDRSRVTALAVRPNKAMQQRVMDRVIESLTIAFADSLDARTVRDTTLATYRRLRSQARLRTFLPALAEREAREELQHLAAVGTAALPLSA